MQELSVSHENGYCMCVDVWNVFTVCCSYFCSFRRQISSGMVTRRYIFWHISIISTTACPALCSHTSTHVMHQVRSFAGNKCLMSHSSVCGIPLGRHTNIFSKTIKAIYVPEMLNVPNVEC